MRKSNAVSLHRDSTLQWGKLLSEYFALRRAEAISQGTIRLYGENIRRFFREHENALDSPDMLREAVFAFLGADHLGAVCYNLRLRTLKGFLEYLRLEGFIPENPCLRFRYRKEPTRTLSMDADLVRRLLEAPETDNFAGFRDHVMFIVSLDVGLRPQEIRKLMPPDVDLEGGNIRVRPEISKTGKARTLPLSAPSVSALRKYLKVRPPEWDSAPLFVTEDGRPMMASTLDGRMRRYRKKIGVDKLPWYSLRHTFCTQMMRSGASMDTLRIMMGHSDYRILQGYVHFDDDDVRREHDAHSPLLSLLPKPTKRVRKI